LFFFPSSWSKTKKRRKTFLCLARGQILLVRGARERRGEYITLLLMTREERKSEEREIRET